MGAGAEVPAELGVVDGLVAGVRHGGGYEWLDAFPFGVSTRDRAAELLGDEHAGGLGPAPRSCIAFALLKGLAYLVGLELEGLACVV